MMTRWLLLLAVSAAVQADYPTPAQAGFHHCALIYETARRGPAEFAPYVADRDGWLFDSFLFLVYGLPRGVDTLTGQTTASDWQWQIDRWFAAGRDLAALDESIEQAARQLGAPPAKRPVIFSLPYLHPKVKDFGHGEDLSTPTGRDAVLRWYLAELQRRFAAAHYRHLSFWGLYWMNEGISPSDEPGVKQTAAATHAAGLRFFWIPWYRAPGWDRWRELGFDVAVMQPNYAFWSTHRGAVRRNRLAINAELARQKGLGVEVELGMDLTNPLEPLYFRQYLRDGSAERYGYQQAATAYYLGSDVIEKLAAAAEPERRAIYDDLAAYVHNRTLAEPDPTVKWLADGHEEPVLGDHRLDGRTAAFHQAETRFAAPRALGEVDVLLNETVETWRGTVVVEGQPAAGGPWQPLGWALRSDTIEADGVWQVVTVPVERTVSALRVSLEGVRGHQAEVAEIELLPAAGQGMRRHQAWRRTYTVEPSWLGRYADDGRKLTDGVIPDGGFGGGQMVGWYGGEVAVAFDLGQVETLSSAEVYLEGGGYGAVEWPASAALMLSLTPPPLSSSGLGSAPLGLHWTLERKIMVTHQRSETDVDGRMEYVLKPQVAARYVTFVFRSRAWLMLGELRAFAGGRNVLAGRPYRLRPAPTPDAQQRYADDGLRLTDGRIADHFVPSDVVGWSDGKPRTTVVDLGQTQPLTAVTAWSLAGGGAGIYAPQSVSVALSDDGQTWRLVGTAQRPAIAEAGQTTAACPYRVTLPTGAQGRFVQVTATPSKGWAMLSEVEVE